MLELEGVPVMDGIGLVEVKVNVPWAVVKGKTSPTCVPFGFVPCNWTVPSFPTSPVAASDVAWMTWDGQGAG